MVAEPNEGEASGVAESVDDRLGPAALDTGEG